MRNEKSETKYEMHISWVGPFGGQQNWTRCISV